MIPISSQNRSSNDATYTPPRLPACLADAHTLTPIVGVPTAEEVKAIHEAIRALNTILGVPALYDPELPMRLAQHLFDVQMAVYRSKYSFSILLEDATYTPPQLPAHIPITLEPVVGAPSDEQLKSAQSAVHAVGLLANGALAFDADLNMNLSQYLFNIQIARYIQRSTQGQFAPHTRQTQLQERRQPMVIDPASEVALVVGSGSDIQDRAGSVGPGEQCADAAAEPLQSSVSDHGLTEQHTRSTQFPEETNARIAPGEATRMLGEIGEELRIIRNTLISTQRSLIWSKSNSDASALVDENGDLPSKYGLPRLVRGRKHDSKGTCNYDMYGNPNYFYLRKSSGGDLTAQQLAAYLKFYNIGSDLIEDHGEATIVPGKEEDAEILLYNYLYEALGRVA